MGRASTQQFKNGIDRFSPLAKDLFQNSSKKAHVSPGSNPGSIDDFSKTSFQAKIYFIFFSQK